MKKLISLFLALTLCFTLAACGSKPSSSKSTAAPVASSGGTSTAAPVEKKDPVTIEFWTLGLQPTFTDYINGVINDFQTEYNWVTVKWVDLPWDGFQEKITASIGANKAPDVINVWTKLVMSYASNGALLNLSEAAKPEELALYQDNLLDSNSLKGSVYGIPWYVTPPVCTYNTKLFEQAGLTTTPKDTNEMLEMSKTFKEKTGEFLFYPYEMIQVLFCDGVPLLNEDMTAAAFNTPETVELLTKMQQAVKDGYLPKTDWNNWDNMIKLYAQNKLGMINLGAQTVSRIKNEAPNMMESTGVAEPMLGTAGVSPGALQSLVIPKNSKHHEEALLFSTFLTNDKNVLEFCKLAAIIPSTKTASQDAFFHSDKETPEGLARSISANAASISFDLGIGVEKGGEVYDLISKMYEPIILAGKDVQTVLNETEAEVNKLLK